MSRKYIFEADDDQPTDNTETPTVDTGDDSSEGDTDSNTDNDGEENNSEENTEDEQNNDNQEEENSEEDQNEDNDYDIDTEPDAEEENTNDNTEDSGNSDSEKTDNSNTDTEEKELDRELFDTLSESEKKRKISTLKKLYMELYSKCNTLIDKFNQITDDGNEDFNPVIKRILTVLYEMKEYVSYYLLNVYDNNSYIENDINFNRYLSVLNGIKHITEELQKEKKKESEE